MKITKTIQATIISKEEAQKLLSGTFEYFGTVDGSKRKVDIYSKNAIKFFRIEGNGLSGVGPGYRVGCLSQPAGNPRLFHEDLYSTMLSSSPFQAVSSTLFFQGEGYDTQSAYEDTMSKIATETGYPSFVDNMNTIEFQDAYYKKDMEHRKALAESHLILA